MRKTVVNICRIILALTFIFSGFVKAVDPLGTQYKIHDYLAAMGLSTFAPDILTLLAAVLLAAMEFLLGICLLFAIRRRLVSKVVLGLMVIMTPLTLWVALADPVSDCGCFGDALVLTNWQTFWKNVVLLCAAIIVWKAPTLQPRLIGENNQWIVFNYSVIFILFVIAGRSLYTLPQFDFRPYHIGADLRAGWQRMMDGEDSPMAEFFIERAEDGEDITEAVLNDSGSHRQHGQGHQPLVRHDWGRVPVLSYGRHHPEDRHTVEPRLAAPPRRRGHPQMESQRPAV